MTDALPFTISHTRLQSFRRCRKEYWWSYVSGERWPESEPNAAGLVGTGVHRALQHLTETGDEDVGARTLEAYLRMPAHAIAGDGTAAYSEAFTLYSRGCEAHASIASEERWAEKDTYAPFPRGGIHIFARVDRIDRLGPLHWQIIDWKTGHFDDDERTDDQLDLAQVALRTCLRSLVRREARVTTIGWNLRSGYRRVRELVRDDAVATLQRYAAHARAIQATADFPALPGRHCGFCRWRPRCPEADEGAIAAEWDDVELDDAGDPAFEGTDPGPA